MSLWTGKCPSQDRPLTWRWCRKVNCHSPRWRWRRRRRPPRRAARPGGSLWCPPCGSTHWPGHRNTQTTGRSTPLGDIHKYDTLIKNNFFKARQTQLTQLTNQDVGSGQNSSSSRSSSSSRIRALLLLSAKTATALSSRNGWPWTVPCNVMLPTTTQRLHGTSLHPRVCANVCTSSANSLYFNVTIAELSCSE